MKNHQLVNIDLANQSYLLWMPNPSYIEQSFLINQQINPSTPVPYWSKLWPASIALSNFIIDNQQYVTNKKVLELAAGLGLPSLISAQYAYEVMYSDYIDDPIQLFKQNAAYHQLTNVVSYNINWHQVPENLQPHTLLLSDVNYQTNEFDALLTLIKYYLAKKTTILLSTPQRITSVKFIEKILPYCIKQQLFWVNDTNCVVYVLQQ